MPRYKLPTPLPRECDVEECSSDARYGGCYCERHHTQIRRGKLPGYYRHPKGRRPKVAHLVPNQSDLRIIEEISNNAANIIFQASKTPEDVSRLSDALLAGPLISALTDDAAVRARVGDNVIKNVESNGSLHHKLEIIQLATENLSPAESQAAFTHTSQRTLARAQRLSANELLRQRYASNTTRVRVKPEEIEWVKNFWRDHSTPAPPAQHGATIQLHRGDSETCVSKYLQRFTDKDVYGMYQLEWKEKSEEAPRSKAFLVANKYVSSHLHNSN